MGVLAPTNGPVKILTHAGSPNVADGIFTKGSQAMDTSDTLYVCTASGTPGTWVSVSGGGGGGSVTSVFGRDGDVVAETGDYTVGEVTGAAPLASPALTGSPTAPTQTPGDNTTKLATDAFVAAAIAPLAPLASPALTGSPTAPTQTPGDNTTKLATDAFVAAAIAPLAPLASPALTGSPTAPTQTPGDNTTKLATDAFVAAAIAATPVTGAVVAGPGSGTTASAVFADLSATPVSLTKVTGSLALVIISAKVFNDTNAASTAVGLDVSGATTIAADDTLAVLGGNPFLAGVANTFFQMSYVRLVVLTPGSNVFKLKALATAGNSTIQNAYLTVIPLN